MASTAAVWEQHVLYQVQACHEGERRPTAQEEAVIVQRLKLQPHSSYHAWHLR